MPLRREIQAQLETTARIVDYVSVGDPLYREKQRLVVSGSGSRGNPKMALMAPPSNEKKRVKVYELRNNDWFDRGTGFCTGRVINVRNFKVDSRTLAAGL